MDSRKLILAILVSLALVRGIIYASVVPPWQAPDEPAQFERAKASLLTTEWNATAQNGPVWYNDLRKSLYQTNFWNFVARKRVADNLPLNQYIELYQEIYDGLYSSQITYALMGWPLFFAKNAAILPQLYLLRLYTILFNVGMILLGYSITKTVFPDDTFLILGVPILILFNPQHTHLLSTINNGNLAELLTTTALLFLIKGVVNGFSPKNIAAVLVFTLAAMWAKATAYFLPVAIGSVGMFFVWRYRHHWRWLLPAGLGLVALAIFLMPARLSLLTTWAWQDIWGGNVYLNPIVPKIMFGSFWALPGWLTLQLDRFWYQILLIFYGLAVMGLLLLIVTQWRLLLSKQHHPQIQALIVLAVAALVAIAIPLIWSALSNTVTYRQGRSIYPVIVPVCIFLAMGWRQLIPKNWRAFGLLTITSLLFLFDSLVLFYYIIPFFYSRY